MKVFANNINMYYEKTGSGAPLILLHGNGEDHHIFDEIILKLKNDFTVYAVDSRNHGQSEKTDVYSYETIAEDIYCFMDVLNLTEPYLMGFSDGAIVGLLLAMKYKNIFKKMALLGVNLKPADFTEETYFLMKQTYEATKNPLFKMMLEQPNIEFSDVSNVTIPVLLVVGENDIFKPETIMHLASSLPGSVLKIMKGHNHDSYIIHNDVLYDDLARFFI